MHIFLSSSFSANMFYRSTRGELRYVITGIAGVLENKVLGTFHGLDD